MGGSIGWADPDLKLEVAFCHNRMINARDIGSDSAVAVGDMIRSML